MQRVALPRACCGWRALHSAAASRQQPAPRMHHPAPLAQHHPRLRGCTLAGSRLFRCAAAAAAAPLEAAALAPPPPPHFIVVDASPLLYAAHYAFEGTGRERLRTKGGEDTSVAFAFLKAMLTLLEMRPTHFCVVFDPPSNAPLPAGVAARWRPNATALLPVALPPAVPGVRTWRHDLYPTYKAARAPPPPLLLESIPLVQELLDALALPWVSVAGVEADDVVATLAAAGGAHALRTAVVSPDKDFQQLLSEGVHMLRPARRRRGAAYVPTPDFEPHTADAFRAATGLEPSQFVDYLALVGDAVDNIPGVAGVGDKTAAALLQAHGSLEAVLAAAAAGAITPTRAAKALAQPRAADDARMSKALAQLHADVDVPSLRVPAAAWQLARPADGGAAAAAAVQRLEMYTLAKRVDALWA